MEFVTGSFEGPAWSILLRQGLCIRTLDAPLCLGVRLDTAPKPISGALYVSRLLTIPPFLHVSPLFKLFFSPFFVLLSRLYPFHTYHLMQLSLF